MDYPPALGLEAGVCYCLSLDIILKFTKAAMLEFSDSPTQILMVFLSSKVECSNKISPLLHSYFYNINIFNASLKSQFSFIHNVDEL